MPFECLCFEFCLAVACRAMACNSVACNAVACNVVSCNAVACNEVACNAGAGNAVACHAVACHTVAWERTKSCFCRVFNFKLGSFVLLHRKCMVYISPLLELKTRPLNLVFPWQILCLSS